MGDELGWDWQQLGAAVEGCQHERVGGFRQIYSSNTVLPHINFYWMSIHRTVLIFVYQFSKLALVIRIKSLSVHF